VTKGTNEPYRMFTSRAEFRLNLRIDNADSRLTPVGRRVGLVSDSHWQQYLERQGRLDRLRERLVSTRIDPGSVFLTSRNIKLSERPSVCGILRRPEIRLQDLLDEGIVSTDALLREDVVSVETDIKYEGYLKQQEREVEKLRKSENKRLPEDLDFTEMPGLSREIVEKLQRVRPRSIAQASRIPGMTPAAVSILLLHIELRRDRAQSGSVA
jgi:tRNA uridine 5-carboxymethylaminomethyl modification enzyme